MEIVGFCRKVFWNIFKKVKAKRINAVFVDLYRVFFFISYPFKCLF
ncbi:hypothetical protein SAMD00020551_1464 [Mesobacillus selenatarsenatis SF-1]|uniref:Uncharacterized protein n=1 Tax=Mesobacillus selenatarsenatis (strain DSM 18680 / JCM 14380 / FERM P-15431 / SF-1) TaxID=1321606 RepID=A0A0A8X2R8_MESS1|nr:hypothetical protein SAMD00020551_1464 [Mesobacillus selenatarsenatis SF-1]